MTIQQINIGAAPNDKTGDKLRDSFDKVNKNFTELDNRANDHDTALSGKVDKVAGKGLSTNDFTNEAKDKLAGLEGSHFRGTFTDLAALQAAIPTANPGDYADVDTGAGSDVQRYIWDTSDTKWVQQGAATTITAAQVKTLYESNPDTNPFTDAAEAALANAVPEAPQDSKQYARKNKTWVEVVSSSSVEIPSGADLNNYKTPGTYHCPTAAIAATLVNAPITNNAFSLTVDSINPTPGTDMVFQTVRGYATTGMHIRALATGAVMAWSPVYSLYTPVPLATPEAAGLMSAADKSKLDASSGSGDAMYSVGTHNGPRSSIAEFSPGRIAADGQTLTYAAYPKVCQDVWDGKLNAVDQSVWPTRRNCWGKGDGATYVTVPNLNMADGSAPPFYLRGGPEGINGTWVGDAIRNITGTVGGVVFNTTSTTVGALGQGSTLINSLALPSNGASGVRDIVLNASNIVPTANENRVKTAYIVYTIRIYNATTNQQAIDIATVANDATDIRAKHNTLDTSLSFTIIYPNGGSASAPANVAPNSRYVMDNPFPGFHVFCEAELQYAGQWGSSGHYTDFTSPQRLNRFTAAHPLYEADGSSKIIVQTGAHAIADTSGNSGTPLAIPGTGVETLNLPCRVKVWKLKGAI